MGKIARVVILGIGDPAITLKDLSGGETERDKALMIGAARCGAAYYQLWRVEVGEVAYEVSGFREMDPASSGKYQLASICIMCAN